MRTIFDDKAPEAVAMAGLRYTGRANGEIND
jgi:hypothetical protein